MLTALILGASMPQSSWEAFRPRFNAAIWDDLQLNGTIGNGNELGWLWYNGARDAPEERKLHIQDMTCTPERKAWNCTFILLREGGVVQVYGEYAPDRIACSTVLIRIPEEKDGWMVRRALVPDRAHTQTATQCRAAPLP